LITPQSETSTYEKLKNNNRSRLALNANQILSKSYDYKNNNLNVGHRHSESFNHGEYGIQKLHKMGLVKDELNTNDDNLFMIDYISPIKYKLNRLSKHLQYASLNNKNDHMLPKTNGLRYPKNHLLKLNYDYISGFRQRNVGPNI